MSASVRVISDGYSDGVCVCVCVRACVRACVCVCALELFALFALSILHWKDAFCVIPLHYYRYYSCLRKPSVKHRFVTQCLEAYVSLAE